MGNLDKKVDFSIIRYANCWEDPKVLLQGLAPKRSSKILSIASAGDNSFSLLVTNPELVVAVDVNLTQLYLVELKKAAIRSLDYEDILVFLGFHEGVDRYGSTEAEPISSIAVAELASETHTFSLKQGLPVGRIFHKASQKVTISFLLLFLKTSYSRSTELKWERFFLTTTIQQHLLN